VVRPNSQLTAEERAFLSALWQAPAERAENSDLLCRLMPHGDASAFWSYFAEDSLEIIGRHAAFSYHFPVRIRGGGHEPMHLEVGPPEIRDERRKPRALRIQPQGDEVCLRGRAGQPGCTPVLDISASGIALPEGVLPRRGRPVNVPELELLLPDEAPLPLRVNLAPGQRRRHRLVLNLDAHDSRVQNAVRRYIFRAHLRQGGARG